MKFSGNILVFILIVLFVFIQCTSKTESNQNQQENSVSNKIDHKAEDKEELTSVIFECNYFNNPKPSLKAELFAPDIFVNEDHQHSSPCFSPDGKEIYWSSGIRVKNTKSRKQVIYFSRYEDGKWSNPEIVSFSGDYSDGGPFITYDNKKMFFYSNRPITQGAKIKSDDDIWYVERVDLNWSEPIRLQFNTDFNETMPSVSEKGTVYFAAQYKEEGSFHIYYSELKDGLYEQPRSIGPSINNDFRMSPYIAPDESYIIYATLNAPLKISFRNADGSWGKHRSLGSIINTGKSQRFPMLTPDSKYLFFTSYKGGKEERYWIDAEFLFK
ncbi:MAG: hypothetical protein GY839_03280 [candidate division Zixibacteria bacterium]|nr:hypothetical protein [candidate division Zixibacteria bacterium]